jgi:uncharacterized protein (TIGR02270 family)
MISVIRVIVEQHAEDAAFLWAARSAALEAPDTRLEDLVRLDERIEANLDGLRIAGHAGRRVARLALRGGDAGEVFAAAVLACESTREGTLARLIEEAPAKEVVGGLCGAVSWVPFGRQRLAIEELRKGASSIERRAALVALVAHRRDPGTALLSAVLDDDPLLVATAVRAIGELSRSDLMVVLEAAMLADEPESRFWAAWSAVLLGDAKGTAVLRAIAEHGGPRAEQAAEIVAMTLGPAEAMAFVEALSGRDADRRSATRAAAALGDPKLVPMLLEWLDEPALARRAADAVSSITGMAIVGELAADAPTRAADDADEDDDVIDPDDGLSWPDPIAARKAWGQSKASFHSGTRHVLGRPMNPSSLWRALTEGRQPERARAAFELARRGEPLFDVSAPCHRQLRALAGRN